MTQVTVGAWTGDLHRKSKPTILQIKPCSTHFTANLESQPLHASGAPQAREVKF